MKFSDSYKKKSKNLWRKTGSYYCKKRGIKFGGY